MSAKRHAGSARPHEAIAMMDDYGMWLGYFWQSLSQEREDWQPPEYCHSPYEPPIELESSCLANPPSKLD
jgi:hypothetical protein